MRRGIVRIALCLHSSNDAMPDMGYAAPGDEYRARAHERRTGVSSTVSTETALRTREANSAAAERIRPDSIADGADGGKVQRRAARKPVSRTRGE